MQKDSYGHQEQASLVSRSREIVTWSGSSLNRKGRDMLYRNLWLVQKRSENSLPKRVSVVKIHLGMDACPLDGFTSSVDPYTLL